MHSVSCERIKKCSVTLKRAVPQRRTALDWVASRPALRGGGSYDVITLMIMYCNARERSDDTTETRRGGSQERELMSSGPRCIHSVPSSGFLSPAPPLYSAGPR